MKKKVMTYLDRKCEEKGWQREMVWRKDENGNTKMYYEGKIAGIHKNSANMTPWEYFLCKTFVWGGWGWGETAVNAIKCVGTGLVGLGLLLVLPLYPLFILWVSLTKPGNSRKFLRNLPPEKPRKI